MSDIIVRGKDAETGQQKEVGPDDRIIDTGGIPVAGGKIIKYLTTTGSITTTIVTLSLEEDKAYTICAKVIARNIDANGENASFVLAQALAYRDVAGAAVLIGSPTFIKVDIGGTSWTCVLDTSGNDVRVRVTGALATNVKWCADVEFVEVRG